MSTSTPIESFSIKSLPSADLPAIFAYNLPPKVTILESIPSPTYKQSSPLLSVPNFDEKLVPHSSSTAQIVAVPFLHLSPVIGGAKTGNYAIPPDTVGGAVTFLNLSK